MGAPICPRPQNARVAMGISLPAVACDDDRMSEDDYVEWSHDWLDECIRVLKPGGALFTYNLPRWNIVFGAHLMVREMTFRHWIAISMKAGLPIPGRLARAGCAG